MLLDLGIQPRSWQLAAHDLWKKNGNKGILEVVTGGGKTIFAGICATDFFSEKPKGFVFVVVPTIELAKQWKRTFTEEFNAASENIALFGGGSKPSHFEQINILVANTARKLLPLVSDEHKERSLLVADECHRMASFENSMALQGNWGASLGLSATPKREFDELFEEVLVPALGPIIYEYGYVEAGQDSIIVPYHLVNLEVGLLPEEQAEYDELTLRVQQLLARRARGERVETLLKQTFRRRASVSKNASLRVPIAAKCLDEYQGLRAVVFHESIHEAERIVSLLDQRGHRVAAYHSKQSSDMRSFNFESFRKGRIDVLVTCRALDEGVNVPEAKVAVIASSTSSARQRIQRLGRVLRPHPSKDASTIFTLFCTPNEEDRLRLEEQEGAAYSTKWLSAGLS